MYPIRSIMVALDGSSLGEYALPLALGIARRAAAAVELVHVCSQAPAVPPEQLGLPPSSATHERARAQAEQYLAQLAGSLAERWDVLIRATVLDAPEGQGSPAAVLDAHARATGADLVVATTHGRGGLTRLWMGSVADQLARCLPMPLLLVRPHAEALDVLESVHEQVFGHILIPLDGSALAEQVVAPAVAIGQLMGARYTLLQAIEAVIVDYSPGAARLSEQVFKEWRDAARAYLEQVAGRMRSQGCAVETRVIALPPAMAIIDYAREHDADLIAMSSHGRGAAARLLLGSVADKVVRGAGAPVLILAPRAGGERAIGPQAAGDQPLDR